MQRKNDVSFQLHLLIYMVITVMLFGSFIVINVGAQEPKQKTRSSCSIPSDAVRDHYDETIIFTSEQLMERIRKRKPIERPGGLGRNNLAGVVLVDVVVGKDGRLTCIIPKEGNPIARAAVSRSLRKWVFKGYRSGKEKKSMVGVLSVPFDFRK